MLTLVYCLLGRHIVNQQLPTPNTPSPRIKHLRSKGPNTRRSEISLGIRMMRTGMGGVLEVVLMKTWKKWIDRMKVNRIMRRDSPLPPMTHSLLVISVIVLPIVQICFSRETSYGYVCGIYFHQIFFAR